MGESNVRWGRVRLCGECKVKRGRVSQVGSVMSGGGV